MVYSQDSGSPYIACTNVQGNPICSPPGSGATGRSESANANSISNTSISVKVLNPLNKKEFSIYTLRDISLEDFETPESLKETVVTQVGEATVSRMLDFQIGYYNKSEKRWIHNQRDIHEAKELLKRSEKFTLWCIGKSQERASKKRTVSDKHTPDRESPSDVDADDEIPDSSAKKRKLNPREERGIRVNELKNKLSQEHGSKYSAVQYRLWAEMIVGGVHEGLTEAPSAPMFGTKRPCGQSGQSELTEALTGMANTIATALSPTSNQRGSSTASTSCASPNKTSDLRSKYIRQLKELVELHKIGALSDEEYQEQRHAVVGLLRQLD